MPADAQITDSRRVDEQSPKVYVAVLHEIDITLEINAMAIFTKRLIAETWARSAKAVLHPMLFVPRLCKSTS